MLQPILASFSRVVTAVSVLTVLATGSLRAQTPVIVTIGTGTAASSTNVLLSTSITTNKYARTASIYSAAELQAAGARAGSIMRLSWFKGGVGEYPSGDAELRIYLKGTTATALSANPAVWATEVVGATQVYSNTALSLPAGTGWKDFVFSTPFAWNGTDNVEVLVDWFRNSTPTGDISWQYTAVSATSGAHATQVNSAVIPTVRWAANRPNVQFQLALVSATRSQAPAGWVQVAPNPFRGSLQLRVGAGSQQQPLQVTLTDALGRQHGQWQTSAGADRTLHLPTSLAAGLYLLTVRNEHWHQTLRLLHD